MSSPDKTDKTSKASATSLKSTDKASKISVKSEKSSKHSENSSRSNFAEPYVDNYYETSQDPVFIYGGPFIQVKRPDPFIDSVTPINLELQGTFKKSFAYYSMKERIPIILTKVIDGLSKRGDPDSRKLIEYVARLKNEIVTNKRYSKFEVDTDEAKRWNSWLESRQANTYFTDVWVFAECYVYRRLREGVELIPSLNDFDPFGDQKKQAFEDGKEAMCMVATQLMPMLSPSDKDKRKQNFMTLLKICLWSNKCDLSLSVGEPVLLASGETGKDPSQMPAVDPFQLVIDFKDKLLTDDTAKIADQVVAKAEAIGKAIANNTVFKAKCSCHRLAKLGGTRICMDEAQKEALAKAAAEKAAKGKGKGKAPPPPPPPPPEPGAPPPPPPVPCPAKVLVPSAVQFDIVCDNAGFELFADLCLATWLVEQKIVQKIRFYVKKIPWFVSDVTPKDFTDLIQMCCNTQYSRRAPPPEPKKPLAEGEAPPPDTNVTSAELQSLGRKFQQYYDEGVFVVSCEDFWTSPHVFKDMKKYDYWLYRKLQYAVAVLFKGDLNYRKLLGEKNVPPITPLLQALQGDLNYRKLLGEKNVPPITPLLQALQGDLNYRKLLGEKNVPPITPLLQALQDAEQLIRDQFAEIFKPGWGNFKGEVINLKLKSNAQPRCLPVSVSKASYLMKTYDYWLYRKLQYAVAVLFKGDLNYRKLLGEKNVPPITPLLQALQGDLNYRKLLGEKNVPPITPLLQALQGDLNYRKLLGEKNVPPITPLLQALQGDLNYRKLLGEKNVPPITPLLQALQGDLNYRKLLGEKNVPPITPLLQALQGNCLERRMCRLLHHYCKLCKTYDYWLYRKLQYAVAVLFKGDLNYRKLLGEKNVPPITQLLQALQGFQPAPLIACRTVKCDLICGLKKGRAEQLFKIDPKWMQTGDYGVIQFCPKAEPLKVADRPCKFYCAECLGLTCPDEGRFW
ncbi:uncharacterized protein LOC134658625 [Cydia amplana]|uniref:uncharacterized protein LOC134658625 n=1 Tax=Cydia amplana TaxID=1869771 RepID=UPI002FE5B54E